MLRARLLVLFALVACAQDADPGTSDGRFDEEALAAFAPDDRAYVMGHALAISLYAQTLPGYVEGTGYVYVPGRSSAIARVPYDYASVMNAGGGGCDCSGGDCVGDCGGVPPQEPPPPQLDEDCETFLDPAAMDARTLGRDVDIAAMIGSLDPDRFARGMADALALEDLDENTDHSEVEHLKEHVQEEGLCEHSPLVLDLAGDGIAASPPEVRFDLKATGVRHLVAWPRGDDAFLAYDRDGDGRITHGGELFGNHGAANGFESLAALDNGDGVIDARDPAFAQLRLWRDANRDGISSDGELVPLAAESIAALPLAYMPSSARDPFGNALAQHGEFVRGDGRRGVMIDVWLRLRR